MDTVLLLGGNVGDVRTTLAAAITHIAERIGPVLSISRDHWTEPWGFSDQRLFLNKAVLVRTGLSPEATLRECLVIERELGRERLPEVRYSARTVDIDILFFGDRIIEESGLSIPHPRLHERTFALAPAADIVPSFRHPALKRTVLELLDDLRRSGTA